ncbi:MAG TPA: polysaccharide deacetylase family protein [Vicinamibacterales bacterium]
MNAAAHCLGLSIDLDEWYHSRRWIDGEQKQAVPDTDSFFRRVYNSDVPAGEVIGPTHQLLDLLERYGVRCTFFVLGEMVQWYPGLVRELSQRGHEVGCHGLHHVDMTVLGPDPFASELEQAAQALEQVTGTRPVGYRAPNLVYEPWATRILEQLGFKYDSSVCVSRPIGGKYRGWAHAPLHPYRPRYDDVAKPGDAALVEVPLPCFPYLRLAAGSGIITRVFGYQWTAIALRAAIRTGHTAYYFHPWELAPKPPTSRGGLRNAIFFRRTGPWMCSVVERILTTYQGRIVPLRQCAVPDRAQSPAIIGEPASC